MRTPAAAIVSTHGGSTPVQVRWAASEPQYMGGAGQRPGGPRDPAGRPVIRSWLAGRPHSSARAVLITHAKQHSKSDTWIGADHYVRDLAAVRRLVHYWDEEKFSSREGVKRLLRVLRTAETVRRREWIAGQWQQPKETTT
jgi:hypothetical protein